MPEVPAEPQQHFVLAPRPTTPAGHEPAGHEPAGHEPAGHEPELAHARSVHLPPATPATFLSGGYILTFVGGPHPATGHGAELSLIQYLQGDLGPAVGPVLQLQHYSSDGQGHLRFNGGGELALVFGGLELMYSYRGAFAGIEPTHGVTLGPYFSLVGIVHVAGRITIALSDEQSAGNEYGVTLGLKIPALIGGDFFGFGRGPR